MTSSLRGLRRAFGTAILAVFGTLPFLPPGVATAQPLQVTPDVVDFGVLKPGIAVSREVVVRNPGTSRIDVRVQLQGGPFTVDTDTLRLAAGAQRRVPVRFTATDSGTYAGDLKLQIKELFGTETLSVSLRAVVARPAIEVRPISPMEFLISAWMFSCAMTFLFSVAPQLALDGLMLSRDCLDCL